MLETERLPLRLHSHAGGGDAEYTGWGRDIGLNLPPPASPTWPMCEPCDGQAGLSA